MKRAVLTLFFLYTIFQITEGQLWKLKRIEFTAGLGTATFFGDVGGYSHGENWAGLKDITFLQTRYSANLSARYRFTQNWNGRISFSYGLLHATDERGDNQGRGFEAFTNIFEPSVIGEYYFIKNSAENSYLFNKGRGKGFIGLLKSIDFYAFAGFGGLHYSIDGNEKLTAKGFDPEGWSTVIPGGLGGSLAAYPNLNFGFELGFRYAFTDNLDGYTSQYSSANDVYYFFNLTVTYRLKMKRNVLSSFRR